MNLICANKVDLIPQLKWLHAIHNQGHGDAIRGGKAKAEGVKAGVADLFLPYVSPNSGYFGLYIELKTVKGTLAPIQFEFINDMRKVGYAAHMARGWLEARKIILDYLQIALDV